MSDFARALPIVLAAEGGYVDDPDDPGGETNLGITFRTWQKWCADNGLSPKPMRVLTPDDVEPVYRTRYWDAAQCDRLPWPLNLIHFDCAVNTGIGPAIRQLQRALNVRDDGMMGPLTLLRAAPSGPRDCYRYLLERVFYYDNLDVTSPKLTRFLTGAWLGRVRQLYRYVQ